MYMHTSVYIHLKFPLLEATSVLAWNLQKRCVSKLTFKWSAKICIVRTTITLRCSMECWTIAWWEPLVWFPNFFWGIAEVLKKSWGHWNVLFVQSKFKWVFTWILQIISFSVSYSFSCFWRAGVHSHEAGSKLLFWQTAGTGRDMSPKCHNVDEWAVDQLPELCESRSLVSAGAVYKNHLS